MSEPIAIPAESLWTVVDVAKFLKLGRNSVYDLANAGKMPALRIGSRIRFDPAAVRRWASEQRAPTSGTVLPFGTRRP